MPGTVTPRIKALDGLRGVAALVVLLDHVCLMQPLLAQIYDQERFPAPGTGAWWFAMTPLHVIWAGQEAVYLFFVLSGLVLTRSVLNADGFDWSRYFPSRMIRLYLPVWAAVAVAALSMALVPREPDAFSSSWLTRRAAGYDAALLRADLGLLWGDGRFAISPLWSLRWEVLFSLMLPLSVSFVAVARGLWAVKIALVAGCLVVGALQGWEELLYLPMFGVGALLAAHWRTITSALSRLLRPAGVGWPALAMALVLLTARWWTLALRPEPEQLGWTGIVALAGATLLVLLAATWSPAQRFLQWRPVLGLGRMSFSLYLVHESVIIAVRYLVPDQPWGLVAALALPSAVAVAWLFYRGVERPATRLASSIGRDHTRPRSRELVGASSR